MKKPLLVIAALFYMQLSYAQTGDRWSIELNLGRYATITGLFGHVDYSNTFSYINGFNAAYRSTERLQVVAGCRKFNARINNSTGYTVEDNVVEGLEFRTGWLFTPRPQQRLSLGYGLELFGESARLKGNYWVDYPPAYEINHRKYFAGIAPSIRLNLRISKRILLFADTRYRFGRTYLKSFDLTQSDKTLYPERRYWMRVWEPLNAFGIRMILGCAQQ